LGNNVHWRRWQIIDLRLTRKGAGFCGTVFELTPNANGTWTESTLYSFVDAQHRLEFLFRPDP